jgi:hypothetical protein
MDVQTIGLAVVTNGGQSQGWCATEPTRFILRGDQECARLLDKLEQSGVTAFRCLIRTWFTPDDGMAANVFTTTPAFRPGIRLSQGRLREAEHRCWKMGNVIEEVATEAVSSTSAEGRDLVIEAKVVIGDGNEARSISAWVTVISACDSSFNNREIELL